MFWHPNRPKCIEPIFLAFFMHFSFFGIFSNFFQFFPIFFHSKFSWLLSPAQKRLNDFRIDLYGDTDLFCGHFVCWFVCLACLLSICWLNGRIMGFKFRFPLHCIALELSNGIIVLFRVEIYQMKIAEICDEDTARLAVWLLIGLVWHSNFFENLC